MESFLEQAEELVNQKNSLEQECARLKQDDPFRNGNIPICLDFEHIDGHDTFVRRYMFPCPSQPLGVVFEGEEYAGVDVTYKYAPRYKSWLLFEIKVFMGV